MSQRYLIQHDTDYCYSTEVMHSRQLLHLSPRVMPYQETHQQSLHFSVEPSWQEVRLDGFGNPATYLVFERLHARLTVFSRLDVTVAERLLPPLQQSEAWESVRESLRFSGEQRDAALIEASRYRTESPYARIKTPYVRYADDCFLPGLPIASAVMALAEKIHRDFDYAPGATVIGTPLRDILACRRGVCQDFAHLMIACLRSKGLAARYVSGYLRTDPPPGQARLLGVDATHAWVSVWCPPLGWLDFDPTNGVMAKSDHITLAWGRDFGDVSPLRGVIVGGGSHSLTVSVTVMPADNH